MSDESEARLRHCDTQDKITILQLLGSQNKSNFFRARGTGYPKSPDAVRRAAKAERDAKERRLGTRIRVPLAANSGAALAALGIALTAAARGLSAKSEKGLLVPARDGPEAGSKVPMHLGNHQQSRHSMGAL
ncbi:uncharacterized protein CIMG_11060 [Coccidioides immitis RS]|uniref:Uncharacterized protein n=3 Tax=Coccidioides immitis TaxID=5501 RepID=A0A0D8JWD6_COCIM|nr:uncharacterized protein CIMG_11060 [Coccidioides immitis RS]KJF61454.1 hypothetical protein CIMG_11060 [Coccidioides immitis RS]KMU72227.1 hypothetical protein CISG_00536 [Coccidioides immitis RMSCC 3703]KMU82399.1 hypothetical protein CIHG_00182 [Coccidioides immitis H538.4]